MTGSGPGRAAEQVELNGKMLLELRERPGAGALPVGADDDALAAQDAAWSVTALIRAEASRRGLAPSAGTVLYLELPTRDGVEVETVLAPGRAVSADDGALVRLDVTGRTRAEALEGLARALEETVILGVETSIEFLHLLATSPALAAEPLGEEGAQQLLDDAVFPEPDELLVEYAEMSAGLRAIAPAHPAEAPRGEGAGESSGQMAAECFPLDPHTGAPRVPGEGSPASSGQSRPRSPRRRPPLVMDPERVVRAIPGEGRRDSPEGVLVYVSEGARTYQIRVREGDPERFEMGPAILFCPADRPERFGKAADRADAVALDLEDAVSPESKARAREAVVAAEVDPWRALVRMSAWGTPEWDADAAAVARSRMRTVILSKAESLEAVDALAEAVPGARIVPQIETARGVLAAEELAGHPAVVALLWGAEDLADSLGARSTRATEGAYREVIQHGRFRVLYASAAHGKACIDAVLPDFEDEEAQRRDAEEAATSGFRATACIHPRQVGPIRQGYAPTPEEADHARRLLAAAEGQGGAFRFEGQMVDAPIVRRARAVLARASQLSTQR
ncbi:aldolase/citrate lyase family protein [Falsarthrobacter nasiphocae]|nr:aldolase/citrate lyase family protein [Falsarthrobacter nasiphocae]